jgi:hypothetical protein
MRHGADWRMIGRMARVEHILLESDERDIPTLETARRIHARIALPGGSWRPSLELALIDYFYLSVRTTSARSTGSRYVVDLRFVDPAPGLSRRLPVSWIAAGAVFLALAVLGAREIAASAVPWWRHEWLPATAAFFAVAAGALSLAVLRTTETLTLFSAHGRAKLVCHEGGAGTLRAFRGFLPRLEAHLRIARARRRDRAQHLRDEMREHFRLRGTGALTEEEYETAKRRILATHGHSAAGGGSREATGRAKSSAVGRRQAPKKETPPRGGSPSRPCTSA